MKAVVLAVGLFKFLAVASSLGLLCLSHPRLRQRRAVKRSFAVVRWALGLTMVLYGVVKLTGTQLHHELLDCARVTAFGSAQLFWYFFGYSRLYVVFAAAVEIACGLLLASRVTHRLGVLLTLATLTNIVVMDFAFDIAGPKYWALSFLLGTVALLLQELPAYWTAIAALTRSE